MKIFLEFEDGHNHARLYGPFKNIKSAANSIDSQRVDEISSILEEDLYYEDCGDNWYVMTDVDIKDRIKDLEALLHSTPV